MSLVGITLELLHTPALLLGNLLTVELVSEGTLLLRYFHTLLHISTMFHRVLSTLRLGCSITWCSICRLWFLAFLLVSGLTLFFISTFVLVNCLTLLERFLLTVIVIVGSALLLWNELTVILGDFFVDGLGASAALLALLPVHSDVLLYLNLLTILLRNISTLLSGNFLAFFVVFCHTFLLWNLLTTFHILAVFLGHILAVLSVGRLTLFSWN